MTENTDQDSGIAREQVWAMVVSGISMGLGIYGVGHSIGYYVGWSTLARVVGVDGEVYLRRPASATSTYASDLLLMGGLSTMLLVIGLLAIVFAWRMDG